MKMIMLMVLFSTPAEPLPHAEHGFSPRLTDSMEQCLQRRSQMHSYLAANAAPGVQFKAFCVEFEAQGYDEAVDAFKRELGDPA